MRTRSSAQLGVFEDIDTCSSHDKSKLSCFRRQMHGAPTDDSGSVHEAPLGRSIDRRRDVRTGDDKTR